MNEPSNKRIIQRGYDKQKHNECLYFPNSRPTETQQTTSFYSQWNENTPQFLNKPHGATYPKHSSKRLHSEEASNTEAFLANYLSSKQGRELIKKLILKHLDSPQIVSHDDGMF